MTYDVLLVDGVNPPLGPWCACPTEAIRLIAQNRCRAVQENEQAPAGKHIQVAAHPVLECELCPGPLLMHARSGSRNLPLYFVSSLVYSFLSAARLAALLERAVCVLRMYVSNVHCTGSKVGPIWVVSPFRGRSMVHPGPPVV